MTLVHRVWFASGKEKLFSCITPLGIGHRPSPYFYLKGRLLSRANFSVACFGFHLLVDMAWGKKVISRIDPGKQW